MGKRYLENVVTCRSHHGYWILWHMYLCDNILALCVFLRWEVGLRMEPYGGQQLWKVINHFVFLVTCITVITVISPGCQLYQCWAAKCECCWNLSDAELWGDLEPAVVGPCYPESCLVLWYIRYVLSMKCHIKSLGLSLLCLFLGLRKLLASTGQEAGKSWKLVMSLLLPMQHWFEGIFFFWNGVIVVEI